MTVKKVWAVYFSGTGTTKKTVDRIARRLAEALGTDCEVYDYTLPAARRQELTIPSGDVAVVGCPTYAGRVPNLLMPYPRDMVHGKGALAVPVVLFGNRICILFLDCAVCIEDGKLVEVDDVLALLRIAFRENSHAACDCAACLFNQLFHRAQRFAGGNDIVYDQHTLTADLVSLFAGQI